MLRTRLFKYFGIFFVIMGVLNVLLGISVIRNRLISRAQSQVRADLNSAWSFLNGKLEKIETILELTAATPEIETACRNDKWSNPSFKNQLETIRINYGLDFLSLMTADGNVVLRAAQPYNRSDFFLSEPILRNAATGRTVTGITLMSPENLNREQGNLAEKAFIVREKTPKARISSNKTEARGMVMLSAVPVTCLHSTKAVLYGGVLLNRNNDLVSDIKNSVFKKSEAQKAANGTVTIFLKDCRIATTVTHKNGERALGTLVSKEVADRVLDNGLSWVDRAFVVRDWYLTAYDPIRNFNGDVIGMLYVGILERPFKNAIIQIIRDFSVLSGLGIAIMLMVVFLVSGYISKPLHALAKAADIMRHGQIPPKIRMSNASTETRTLIDAFNDMAQELISRERRLKETNISLQSINRSYMETLGFISHELKTPLGSMMNFVYLLREKKFGDMNDKQVMAVKSIDMNVKRITEMVRHYLNLSRIENAELKPNPTRLTVCEDVIKPLLNTLSIEIEEKNMIIKNEIRDSVAILTDYNMTVEVFENLISNAVKYGFKDGTVSLWAEEPENGMIRFHVRNTGEGIPEKEAETIFEKFTRLSRNGEKKKRGTGLGLYITRHIIESHNGSIRVFSRQGAWTEFEFTMPEYNERNNNES